jgi:hypothetical protein
MKFNWGTGILIFIIFFFIAIFSFVYYTTTHDINLVEEDYYPKELAYDSQQEKMRNTANLPEKISFEKTRDMIRLVFPGFINKDSINGSIMLYRPSDHKKDLSYQISLDTACSQVIEAGELLPGKYIIKVDWSFRGKSYYQEEVYLH